MLPFTRHALPSGRAVFAVTLIGVGIAGLLCGDFVGVWGGVPRGTPARAQLALVCALVSVAAGAGLLWRRTALATARALLVGLVLWALLFKGRFVLSQPLTEGTWQSLGENAVLVAGVWVLYASLAGEADRRRAGFATGERGVRIARVIYALAMAAFGFSHFAYLDLTAPLVPAWLPWHVGWAYFTGAAYLAAAVAMLVGVWARLAAVLSTLQMGGFTLLIWVPMALSGPMSPFRRGEFILSWTLTAAGWVVADSYRGSAWRARAKP
ncbi:MAG TPA: hypothetical protein VGR80_01165 [Steroidobacteraceae bacterium]|nr:hypothetical protein [Steroidobacteraceae bacterium]